jgi:hypothetical protein
LPLLDLKLDPPELGLALRLELLEPELNERLPLEKERELPELELEEREE